jgi:hypothetical protein
MSDRKKEKELEEWEKRYRLDHPVYNLNHSGHSFYFGAVSAFLGALMIVPFQMNTVVVTRFAFFCFAIGYAVDWFSKKEWWKEREKFLKFQDL